MNSGSGNFNVSKRWGAGNMVMAQTGSDPSEWPVIKNEVVSSTGEEAKEQEIEDALNEYLVSIDAGVQADLVPLAFGDRGTQLTLLLTDSEMELIYSVGDFIHL